MSTWYSSQLVVYNVPWRIEFVGYFFNTDTRVVGSCLRYWFVQLEKVCTGLFFARTIFELI